MSEAIEAFNAVFEEMSREIEQATTPEQVEEIQQRYESLIDAAELELENALELEQQAFEDEIEQERKASEALIEPDEEGEIEEEPEEEKEEESEKKQPPGLVKKESRAAQVLRNVVRRRVR